MENPTDAPTRMKRVAVEFVILALGLTALIVSELNVQLWGETRLAACIFLGAFAFLKGLPRIGIASILLAASGVLLALASYVWLRMFDDSLTRVLLDATAITMILLSGVLSLIAQEKAHNESRKTD